MQPGDIDWILTSSVPSNAFPWLLLIGNALRWCRLVSKSWLAMQRITVTTYPPRSSRNATCTIAHSLDANPFEEMVDDMKMEAVFRLNPRTSIDDSSLSVLASPGLASPIAIGGNTASPTQRSSPACASIAQASNLAASIEGNLVRIEAQLRLIDDDLQPLAGIGANDVAGSLIFDLDPALFASLLENARGGRSTAKTQRTVAATPLASRSSLPSTQPSRASTVRGAGSQAIAVTTTMIQPATATMTYTLGREFSDLTMSAPQSSRADLAMKPRNASKINHDSCGPWIEHIVISGTSSTARASNPVTTGFQGTASATGLMSDSLTMRDVTIQAGAAQVRYTAFEPFIFRNATYMVGGMVNREWSPTTIASTSPTASLASPALGSSARSATLALSPTAMATYYVNASATSRIATSSSFAGSKALVGAAPAFNTVLAENSRSVKSANLPRTASMNSPNTFTTTVTPTMAVASTPMASPLMMSSTMIAGTTLMEVQPRATAPSSVNPSMFTHVVSRGSGSPARMSHSASMTSVSANTNGKRTTSQWNRVDGLDFQAYGPQCHVVLRDGMALENAGRIPSRRTPNAQAPSTGKLLQRQGAALEDPFAVSTTDIVAKTASTSWMLF